MKPETDPVTSDEMVVRLIWEGFYKVDEILRVRPSAFNPRANETGGISVFRLACMSSADQSLTAMTAEKQGRYAIALLPVVRFRGMLSSRN